MNITGREPYQKGMKPQKSPQIRSASDGQTCTMLIPGVCVGGTETVVGAHLRKFGLAGTGQKPDDLFIIDACHACHRALDLDQYDDARTILRALVQTQQRRRAAGLIRLGQNEETTE